MARKSALREQIYENIRKLPADVDPRAAANVALEILEESAWHFSRDCKRLPAPVIRELLARKPTDATHIYLTLAVHADPKDAALAKSWARAIQGLADLETINRWESSQKKTKFRALAKNKHLLPAIQGAAANGKNVSDDMLAVLVADGSAESVDALIPNLDPKGSAHRLDALRRLRVHAKDTPTLRELLGELDREAVKLGARGKGIAALIGIPDQPQFWFRARISSAANAGPVPAIQISIDVDTRKASWFEVAVAKIARGDIAGYTSFNQSRLHDDPLRIGRCDAASLPAWLASVAKKLRVTWAPPFVSSKVSGAKLAQIANWLVPPV